MKKMMRISDCRRYAGSALLVLAAFAVLAGGVVRVSARGSDDPAMKKLNNTVQNKGDSPASKSFREGRDLIESENWPQAADKFQSYVKEYPKDKDIDAALYWLSYALKKQGKKEEAKTHLLRIVAEFPRSSWSKEAKSMLVELGYQKEINDVLENVRRQNENCELKMLALQSLFESDEERAFTIVSDILKNNTATDCPGLKSAAVSLLGGRGGPRVVPILMDIARNNPDLKLRLTAIKRLGDQKNDSITDELIKIYDGEQSKDVRVQILRAFGESGNARAQAKLIEVARAGNELVLRQYAIRFLGEQHDGASLDTLINLYDSDKTSEIRLQILKALGEREDPRARTKIMDVARHGETPDLRIYAIRQLAGHGRVALTDLLDLYSTESDIVIKQSMLRTIGEINDPRVMDTLYEAARNTANLDIRIQAIRSLGNRDNDPKVTAELINMYDAEQNVQVKAALIRAFGDSKDKNVVKKLIAIARSDSSVELRKLAVRYLGESKDPEALKFLEELLK